VKNNKNILIVCLVILMGTAIACKTLSGLPVSSPTSTLSPANTPTPLPPIPVMPGEENPDEPVFITGKIPYTSPFFLNTISEPFVMLEDAAGFAQRDREFVFPLVGQAIGPVEVTEGQEVIYSLALPSIPQGTMQDLDHDNIPDPGVQVFSISYWSNTWGGPFLEERDGSGWSNAYTSMITDPERKDEIIGGTLLIWAPDDHQKFPSGFGDDGLLFTSDDPTSSVPAGYTIVDLNQEPFRFYKEARPTIELIEGEVAVNDFSGMSYSEAFDALFDKVSREYPFTQEKGINWEQLYLATSGEIAKAKNQQDFYKALRQFAFSIPDAHISLSLDPQIFYDERGGGYGIVLKELSDGKVLVTQVFEPGPAWEAGIQVGAEIISWDGMPVGDAIAQVVPDFGPYSTEHHKRLEQVAFLTRGPQFSAVEVEFKNPEAATPEKAKLDSTSEYESLFASLPVFQGDEMNLPIQGEVLDDSGLGYIKINTFSEDYSLLASTWEYLIQQLIDNEVPGLIIDVRINSGGSGSLATDFAGYFFDQEIPLYKGFYYSNESGQFENDGSESSILPGPMKYEGPIAVLVSPYCISACEGFAYAMSQEERSIIVGNYPTAGAFGEVGRGQYDLPDDISMQFPTGRPETPDGQLLIEGVGVIPDITVPVTEESVLGGSDTVLEAAVQAILDQVNP
jgi:C-terminal processing protease CtpA/Prc